MGDKRFTLIGKHFSGGHSLSQGFLRTCVEDPFSVREIRNDALNLDEKFLRLIDKPIVGV